jgi:hypothetical protein
MNTFIKDREDLEVYVANAMQHTKHSWYVDLVVTQILLDEWTPAFNTDWDKFLANLDYEELLEQGKLLYHVAFMIETDGSFDIVESIKAYDEKDATEYVEANYAGKDWFLLNHELENVNG